jgi:(p)ppGpp synthase/HD superfamily hydrolase
MLKKAQLFAINAHGDQLYGEKSYSVHLEHVVSLLNGYGEIAQVIGYLHDVVEDTKVSIADIKNEFGVFIADCVAILSDESGQNRKERKTKTYAKMSKVSGELELALVVKAADRLANLQASYSGNNTRLLKMYKKEHEVFKYSVQRDGLAIKIWQDIEKLLAN